MKKILLSIAAVAALTAAVPAAASAHSINDRQEALDRRIDQGLRSGALTRPEAARLRGELREAARLEHRYRRDGLTRWERADLDRRFDRISVQIRYERRDGQRDYGQGYGPERPHRW